MSKWLAFLLILISDNRLFAAPLNVLVGQNKPPYIELETQSGYALELLAEIVRRMGHEAVFVFVPNARIRLLLESGNGDIASLQPNDDVDAELFFSQPYVRYQNVVVSRRNDDFTIQHPGDLSRRTVLAFQGAGKNLGADFYDLVATKSGYQETVDQKAQVDMLLYGRVQAIVLDRNIFTYHQKNSAMQTPTVIHELFSSTLYRAAFRDAALQRAFDKALFSVILDDWYKQLQLRYFTELNQDLPNRYRCAELLDLGYP